MDLPIIENRRGANRVQRYSQGALTAAFWLGFGMLMRPIVTFAAWLIGGHFVQHSMLTQEGLLSLVRVPAMYVLVVILIGAALTGWASYNLLRFRHNERRTRQPASVAPAELADFYAISPGQLARWQSAQRIVMIHDEQGMPAPYYTPGSTGDLSRDDVAQNR